MPLSFRINDAWWFWAVYKEVFLWYSSLGFKVQVTEIPGYTDAPVIFSVNGNLTNYSFALHVLMTTVVYELICFPHFYVKFMLAVLDFWWSWENFTIKSTQLQVRGKIEWMYVCMEKLFKDKFMVKLNNALYPSTRGVCQCLSTSTSLICKKKICKHGLHNSVNLLIIFHQVALRIIWYPNQCEVWCFIEPMLYGSWICIEI